MGSGPGSLASRRRRIAHALTYTDWAALRWIAPIRIGVIAGLAVGFALALGGASLAVPVGIGATLIGISDQRGDFADRLRGMLLTTILMVGATAVGLAVSSSFSLHLVAAGLAAAFFGYIGVAGPRAALAGVLGLVTFTVFAGTPEPIAEIPSAVLGILIGGGIQIAALALPLLTRRIGGLRTDISVGIRAVAFAIKGLDGGPASTNAIAKLTVARRQIATSGVLGRTREWCEGLVDRADAVRISILAIEGGSSLRDPGTERVVDELKAATADLLLTISSTLELPVARRGVAARLDRFDSAMGTARATLPPSTERPLTEVEGAVTGLVAEVAGEWPIGIRAELRFRPRFGFEWAKALAGSRGPNELFIRHAVRLTALIVIATAIAEYEPTTHAYWLPLTVAWITKPDLAGTAERVLGRIGGTLLGLGIFGLVAITVGPDESVMLALYVIGLITAAAWFQANYTVCVAGLTPALMALLSFSFPEVTELISPRLVETVLAGALVIAVATIWPTRLTYELGNRLAATARAIRAYGARVAGGGSGDLDSERRAVVTARTESGVLVAAAAHEPVSPGLKIQYEQAQEVLDDLVEAALVALAVEESATGPDRPAPDTGQITDRSLRRLEDLASRLEATQEDRIPGIDRGGAVPADSDLTNFERLIEDAHRAVGVGEAPESDIG